MATMKQQQLFSLINTRPESKKNISKKISPQK